MPTGRCDSFAAAPTLDAMASIHASHGFAASARELRSSHSYAFVLLVILVGFAFIATAPDAPWTRGVVVLIQAATLFIALWTSRSAPLRFRPAVTVPLATVLAVGIAQILTDNESLTTIAGTCSGVLAVSVIVVLVRGIVSEGVVSQRSVIGAICIYLLVGMFFLFAYGLIAVLGSGPFFAQGTDGTPALRLYFSYVTLATLGYGDYSAEANIGHMLSVLEALIGQLYLVTVIAVLVSRMQFDRRKPRGR
jgi:hypothetical protein